MRVDAVVLIGDRSESGGERDALLLARRSVVLPSPSCARDGGRVMCDWARSCRPSSLRWRGAGGDDGESIASRPHASEKDQADAGGRNKQHLLGRRWTTSSISMVRVRLKNQHRRCCHDDLSQTFVNARDGSDDGIDVSRDATVGKSNRLPPRQSQHTRYPNHPTTSWEGSWTEQLGNG